MKKTTSLFTIAAAVAAFAGAVAVPSIARADLAINVGAVSDYRYRGISQSRLKPAAFAGVDWGIGNFYVGAWGSTIRWVKDTGGNAEAELDFYGGYKFELAKDTTLDIGYLRYQYASHKLPTSPNTDEVYGALTAGPVTAKYSHSLSNLFGFSDSKGSGYFDLSAAFEVSGLTLTPHVGYQKVANSGSFSYTDYSLIVSKEVLKGLTLSGGVVGAETKKISGTPAYVSPAGKDLGKAGAVAGLKYVF